MLRWTLLVRNTDANFGVAWLQFIAGLLPNLHHRKSGRIFTAAFALFSPGLLLASANGTLYLSALFAGATLGVFLRQYVSTFYGHPSNEEDPLLRYFYINRPYKNSLEFTKNPKAGLLVALLFLVLERLLTYFGITPFTEGILQDTEFAPGISSKYAFALTLDGLGAWLSALLYFLAEETSSHDTDPPVKHWRTGILAGFTGSLILGMLQAIFPETDFPFSSGNALTFGVSGFFSDAAAFGIAMPILAGYFLYFVHSRNWRIVTRIVLTSAILLPMAIAGRFQGPGFWILTLLQSTVCTGLSYQGGIRNRIWKFAFLPIVLLVSVGLFVGMYFLGGQEWSPTACHLFHDHWAQAWSKGKGISKFLELSWKDGWIQTLSAWNWWKEAPFFGHGFGSFALRWIELGPKGSIPAFGQQDFSLSSLAFLLNEGGVTFFLLFFVWIGFESFSRGTYWTLLLLVFPIFFFLPWVGAAGSLAFLLFYILGSSGASTRMLPKWWIIPIFNLVCLIFGIGITMKTLVRLSGLAQGPEFRYEERKTFQLSAKEKNVSKNGIRVHSFRSGTSWVIGDKNAVNLRVLLPIDPKPGKPVYLKWVFSDEKGIELQSRSTPLPNVSNAVSLTVPSGAKFLTGKILRMSWFEAGPSEFLISTEDFDGLNRIR
ncbi:hypothetical protein EHO61_05660 [Leptospira fluminis]|uniref:O-antigen ligase domain-containing protein n=1 Tax=Leptospira fluminis TaxID=2484979 RepID=A0A4R9GT02_9LEPT|nr:hypothetical protein [Leptospira fluminis]TGK20213.1 hypothetical protein EHO61_05660 [Leptospira fluminis]